MNIDAVGKTKNDDLTKLEKRTVAVYYSSFIFLGFFIASPGPILDALQSQVNVSFATISYIFLARGVGYSFGSFMAGIETDFYANYLKKQQTKETRPLQSRRVITTHEYFSLATFLKIIILLTTPYIENVILLSVIIFVSGICHGEIDTLANVSLLVLLDKHENVGSYMQGLHFCFGIGAFLSPLLIELSFYINNSYDIAYIFIAIGFFPVGVALLWFIPTPQRVQSPSPSPHSDMDKGLQNRPVDHNYNHESGLYRSKSASSIKYLKCTCGYVQIGVFIFALFLAIYEGAEIGYGAYIHTFCTNYNKLSTSNSIGRYMSSVFWGNIAIGRLFAAWLNKKTTPLNILIIDLSGCIVASLLLLALLVVDSESDVAFAWIATGIYGFFMSSLFPAMFVFAENSVTVTGKIASVLTFGGSLGSVIIPALQGNIMAHIGTYAFVWVTFFSTLLMIFVLILAVLITNRLNNIRLMQNASNNIELENKKTPLLQAQDSETEAVLVFH